jgi:hypothetical protein
VQSQHGRSAIPAQSEASTETKMAATFTHQVVIGIDPLMADALEWHNQNIYPRKSRSEFCREAIFEKLARDFPQNPTK